MLWTYITQNLTMVVKNVNLKFDAINKTPKKADFSQASLSSFHSWRFSFILMKRFFIMKKFFINLCDITSLNLV